MKIINTLIFLMFLVFASYGQTRIPKNYSPDRVYKNQKIQDLVDIPEEKMDIGLWSLIIAKEFDNSVDIPLYLNKLDDMVNEINRMLAGRTKDMDKFLAVKMFLYEVGEWNNYKSFSYDLNDPFGNILEHKLLNNYIDYKEGNCISMPTLFLALMERIDPNLHFVGVKVPLHLMCRIRDRQTNDVWNIETTNGANPARNIWYIDKMKISQKALDNRTYLADLTKKEFIANSMVILASKERKKGNYKKALEYCDLILKVMPNNESALVKKGSICAQIAYNKSQNKTLTKQEDKYFREEVEKYINKAKELGWQPQSREQREEYLKSVNIEKNKR